MYDLCRERRDDFSAILLWNWLHLSSTVTDFRLTAVADAVVRHCMQAADR